MTGPISIVLADDHALFCGMLRQRLEREPNCRVVAAVETLEEVLAAVRTSQPDLLLLDIAMPGHCSAFDAARQVKEASPGTRIVFLSGFVQDNYI